jgi:hypothetical protein
LIKWMALLSALLLTLGCQSYETRTYDVTVHNQTSEPITIWLTKDGPPFEGPWLSPEDLAIESPHRDESREIGGAVVDAGKTATTMRKGRFEPRTHAMLRVYDGARKFEELLATSSESAGRKDVTLPPGKSEYIVEPGPGVITVRRQ